MHCKNGHIVESCEITATVAPSAVVMLQNSADPLCYVLCLLFIYALHGFYSILSFGQGSSLLWTHTLRPFIAGPLR